MAVFARQFTVHFLEFEFGVFVVVEFNLEPPGFGVTGVTFLTVISGMGVIHFMAKITIAWRVGIALIGMTIRTHHFFVTLLQLEVGFFVIEA